MRALRTCWHEAMSPSLASARQPDGTSSGASAAPSRRRSSSEAGWGEGVGVGVAAAARRFCSVAR
ncbi:hypothetical protein DVA67_031920 [Solirubrobacter sp. CPCC 204708]|nr:hypothetical protein [Solirubrobacter deserti]